MDKPTWEAQGEFKKNKKEGKSTSHVQYTLAALFAVIVLFVIVYTY